MHNTTYISEEIYFKNPKEVKFLKQVFTMVFVLIFCVMTFSFFSDDLSLDNRTRFRSNVNYFKSIKTIDRRPCDETLTEPETICWYEEEIPGHLDEDCLDICEYSCETLYLSPPQPVEFACCMASCNVMCWVEPQPDPSSMVCETIYPCY